MNNLATHQWIYSELYDSWNITRNTKGILAHCNKCGLIISWISWHGDNNITNSIDWLNLSSFIKRNYIKKCYGKDSFARDIDAVPSCKAEMLRIALCL